MIKYKIFIAAIILAAAAFIPFLLNGKNNNEQTSDTSVVYENTPDVYEPDEAVEITPETVEITPEIIETVPETEKIIVLDAGHGKSSNLMTEDEFIQSGWVKNSGEWGEWRHFKYGSKFTDCEGSGCSGRVTPNGACWYPASYGDRETEPEINLENCIAAKKYLEEMGYTVRMARESNDENPSITKRLTYCYPNNDTEQSPDALAYVCVHSNAGGGAGSSYIELSGEYDQPEIPSDYVEQSNLLGKYINDAITAAVGFSNNPPISGEPELIAFCKSPVICAYLEIGFYDNSSDLEMLRNNADTIGRAIAEGINEYFGGF